MTPETRENARKRAAAILFRPGSTTSLERSLATQITLLCKHAQALEAALTEIVDLPDCDCVANCDSNCDGVRMREIACKALGRA